MRDMIRTLIAGPTLHWEYREDGGCIGWGGSGSYKESERAAAIEDRIRTYMVAGTSVEEFREAVATLRSREHAAMEAAKARWMASKVNA